MCVCVCIYIYIFHPSPSRLLTISVAITSALGWLTKGQRVVRRRIQKLRYRAVSCPLSVALLLTHGRKLSSPSAPTPSRDDLCRLPYLDYPQYTLLYFVLNSAPSFSNFSFVILLFLLFSFFVLIAV